VRGLAATKPLTRLASEPPSPLRWGEGK